MKKLFIIFSLFISVNCFAQDSTYTYTPLDSAVSVLNQNMTFANDKAVVSTETVNFQYWRGYFEALQFVKQILVKYKIIPLQ